MDKGILVIVAIGIAIVYFATNFSGDKPVDGDVSWSVSDKQHPYDPYYEKDVLGDQVLNLTPLSLERAKALWKTTPTAKRIAAVLPDFDLAITEAGNKIVKGDFKQFILDYLEELKGRYLAGQINGDGAKKALLGLH